AAALFPVCLDAKRTALDASNKRQDADGDGGRYHENKGRDHAENGEDKKQSTADNLIKCIHRMYKTASGQKDSPDPLFLRLCWTFQVRPISYERKHRNRSGCTEPCDGPQYQKVTSRRCQERENFA